jgi:hypothetical protein
MATPTARAPGGQNWFSADMDGPYGPLRMGPARKLWRAAEGRVMDASELHRVLRRARGIHHEDRVAGLGEAVRCRVRWRPCSGDEGSAGMCLPIGALSH